VPSLGSSPLNLDRIELADIHDPKRLAKALHRQIGPLSRAVPVEDITIGLGISEIRQDELDGCEGVLLTDRVRSVGKILVNSRRGTRAARFSIAHELGHFLLERHVLGLDGTFTCSRGDMRETRTDRRNKLQEVEANEFAIALLAPEDQLAPYLREQPEIASALAMRDRLDISLEAAMRCLVDRHEEPIAAVWTRNGKIRYAVRGKAFPWIERSAGQSVSSLSRTFSALAKGEPVVVPMAETSAAAWTTTDIPELFEEVRVGRDGHAVTLLWATLPDAGGDDSEAD
jgi:Zn-dependent peptidase ImmA (M78 family)